MQQLTFHEVPFGSEAYEATVALRDDILRKPLGLTFSEQDLDSEWYSYHLAAYFASELVGVLVLKPLDQQVVKMRQVAIAAPHQRKGMGQELVAHAEAFARAKGYQQMVLHARQIAIPFYERLAYDLVGDEFTEVGIPHRKMRKRLPQPVASPATT